jgi:hypothetical protein
MHRPLSVILAGLLIDTPFRNAVKAQSADRTGLKSTLAMHGFFLNKKELDTAMAMAAAFSGGAFASDLDEAAQKVSAACPNWPCDGLTISDI